MPWNRSLPCMVLLLLLAVGLAGCADGDDGPTESGEAVDKDTFDLESGKGAIAGLLVDDAFRPLHLTDDPQTAYQTIGFILLQETGEQVQTTENGEFNFVDLEPGTYTIRAQIGGHETTPSQVTVAAGAFAEKTLIARRIADVGSTILTQEFTAFKACEATLVAYGTAVPCTLDQSGDTDRGHFIADYTEFETATFMVTEFRASQQGFYEIRLTPGPAGCSGNYAIEEIVDGRYLRIVNEKDVPRDENALTCGTVPWNNTESFATVMYVDGIGKGEVPVVGGFGAGFFLAVKGKFIQSVFLGEPEVDVDSYCVLCS